MAYYDKAYFEVVNNKPRYIALMQAAQEGNTSGLGKMTQSEKEVYENLVAEFGFLKKMNGGTLEGIDIDLPYD